jgi:chemotaxis-related protein WspD
MTEPPVNDCWSRIGVRGDVSCPELQHHVHCHNCPVHAEAALALLDREPPAGTHASWTRHFAEPLETGTSGTVAFFVFRLGRDWFAMPVGLVAEVAPERTIHTLPHRPHGVVLGVVNLHGALVVCLSLGAVLGLDGVGSGATERQFERARMLMLRQGDVRAACPVDEVSGIHRIDPAALVETPAAVAGARSCVSHVWPWRDGAVGVIDTTLLCQAIRRSVA